MRPCFTPAAFAGALLCLAVGAGVAQAPRPASIAGMSRARLERITPIMQAAVDSGRIAGAVVLVMRHGQLVYQHAFGWSDREARRPMRADALFRIASQTKAITSVAVMMLVEQGLIRLSDPVSKWLPGLGTVKVAAKSDTGLALVPLRRAITIRDLLTHTAGISYGTDSLVRSAYAAEGLGPNAGYGWYTADKNEPLCVSMDRLGKLPIVAQPGTQFVYGYNTDILGCVVERVSGLSLAEFFGQKIFRPLGMNSTWFFPPESLASRMTVVYTRSDTGLVRSGPGPLGQGDYLSGPRMNYSGGAGLISTAGDYARFLQMLANGGQLHGARILGPRTVALMTADHADTLYSRMGLGFGLGFEVLEDPGHSAQFGNPGRFGWGGAYASNYWVDPQDGIVCVFMTQLLPNPGLDLPDRLRALVYQAVEQ
jgi:CubicO group peptidase (beta-lactamase class C family)